MHKRFGTFWAATALILAGTTASAEMTNVENAYETSANRVSLPAATGGQLTVSACTGCKSVALRIDADTRFTIGGKADRAVTLAEMQKALRAPGANQRLLTVFYRLDNNVVTRVVLAAG